MWKQMPTDKFARRLKQWPKKYKRELGAMMAHLGTIFAALRNGATIENLEFGFVHHESGGVLALDQSGGGAGLKQSRLYVYPHKPNETLHVITMGDKSTQEDDIAYAKAFVDGVKGGDEWREGNIKEG